ncbi:MAG TPA: hypothetical protein PK142_03400 [bacterium]|nr:hypothetical protein [bacterium]
MKKLFLNLCLWLFPVGKMTKIIVDELIKIDQELEVFLACRECLGPFVRFFSLYSSFQISIIDGVIRKVKRRNLFGQYNELLKSLTGLKNFFEDIKKSKYNRSENEPITIFNIFIKDQSVFDWLRSDQKEGLPEANLAAKSFLLTKSMSLKRTIESLRSFN